MNKLEAIADSAEMIINGYAFIKAGNNVKVINLNNPNTFDGIILYIILGCVSIVVLGIGVYSFRKNNC